MSRIGEMFGWCTGERTSAGTRSGVRRKSAAALAVASAAMLVAACGSSSSGKVKAATSSSSPSAAPQHLTGVVVPTPLSWLTLFAKDAGFFSHNGLNVSLLTINTLPQAIAALQSGAAQFGSGEDMVAAGLILYKNIDMKTFAGQGKEWVVVVGAGSTPSPQFPQSIRAIAGNTIAITALGSEQQDTMEIVDEIAGLPATAMKYTAALSVAGEVSALESHRVSYAVIDGTGTERLIAAKFPFHFILDLRKPLAGPGASTAAGKLVNKIMGRPETVASGLSSWVDSHASAVKKLQLSFEETDCFVHDSANVAKLIGFVSKAGEMPAGLSATQQQQYIEANLPISYYPVSQWNTWYHLLRKIGVFTKPFSPESLYLSSTPQSPAQVYSNVTAAGGSCPAYAKYAK